MYNPSFPKPQLVQEDDGANSPLDHQRAISKLTVGLGVLFYRERAITLEPLPETPLGEGSGHQVPDVLLFDNEVQLTRIIIEIAQPRTANRDLRKIIHLIEDDDYGIEEGFVYNYHAHEWLRYRKGDGGAATASSFSEVMGVDLGPMLY
jgi:Uma2 family endonuclease